MALLRIRLMPRLLDHKELARYHADGFLPFAPLLPVSELRLIRETLQQLHSRNAGFKEGALFDAMGVDDGSEPRRFPQILHPRSFAPSLVNTEFFRAAHGIARQLLGEN